MIIKYKLFAAVISLMLISPVQASPRETIMEILTSEAKANNGDFSGFSALAGRELFLGVFGTGKPDTPSCTTCHGSSPVGMGETRAGKAIDPIAVSATPDRFTDQEKVDKWFRRNCNSVLGRECSAQEKGDFLTFMINE